ncbi:MFS transporter [Paenibacillus sp. sptzw28]|uniref:MFS transporter n=1 Tax=Paenibacillus sp. sptzw28 TaxID=715179 RepID=UPI001C6F2EE0|nr:MFS transporter [Paenibacillus sp. sptzw28]QYR22033.1 MFS transporter [Paenibacillus sp. sptzw28]
MNNRLPVLASIVMGMLVSSMDTTITNTTMPVIAKELGNFELYAWVFAGYMIFSTVVSPIAGRISDLFGRKRVFAAGLVLFLLGSILCGSAQTMVQLVIFRAVQGIGAGVMNPFPAIIAGDLFSVEKRGRIQALFTAMWGLSAILAPMLGSLFVTYTTWRWVFYVNIPICLLSLLLLVPYREVYQPKRSKVDYLGGVIFSSGISLILLMTVVGAPYLALLSGGTGLALIVLFYLYEKRQSAPLVPLELLRNKPVTWMNVNAFFAMASLFGAASYLPMFLQEQGYSIFMSGVAMLGMSFGWMAVAVPSGKWILRYGYRRLMISANVILVGTGGWFLFLSPASGFWFVFAGAVMLGLAYGLLSSVSTIGSQQLVDAHQKGISTSLQMFSRNIGTAVGVTIMGAFLAHTTNLMAGYSHIFVYGFAVSAVSLACSFMIQEKKRGELVPASAR